MPYQVFDAHADKYDAWYDTKVGKAIFAVEVDCLKPLIHRLNRPYLEVGLGSGRFAQALSVEYGVDPTLAMLRMAKARGIQVAKATGEELPFPDRMFGGVLIALTLCFVNDPRRVLQEVWKVLQPKGGLVLGFIPQASPWADFYASKGKEGHPIYSKARFFSKGEMEDLLQLSGFKVLDYCSTLFQPPGQDRYHPERQVFGYRKSAGFVAIGSRKQATSQYK
jgi:ubiquinone/menaquinone biosynthesis C-methylase UbiE